MANSESAAASGVGAVIRKGVVAEGGIVSGEGEIIRKDGTRTKFTLTSDPLTKEQADEINERGRI